MPGKGRRDRHKLLYARRRSEGRCLWCETTAAEGTAFCARHARWRKLRRTTVDARVRELVANARFRAKRQGVPFDLTREWLRSMWDKQNGACALSGVPFDISLWEERGQNPRAPSLDRIVAGAGYTRENVRLVNVFWNTALSNWGERVVAEMLGRQAA